MNAVEYMALLMVGFAIFSRPAHAQIVTENAGVISPETPILRESVSYLDAENAREARWTHQILLAIDPKREFRLTVPTIWKEVEFVGPNLRHEEESLSGLGDISLRFKHSLWQRDDVMESTRWAAMAEVGAPTGKDDADEDDFDIPRRLQVGTGDWSIGGGSAFTVIRDRHRFSAEIFFRHRTPHDRVRLGQTIDLNLAYWYRLVPASFATAEDPEVVRAKLPPSPPAPLPLRGRGGNEASGRPVEIRGVIEALTTFRLESDVAGRGADDQGTVTWLAPGIQVYPWRRVLLEANVQFPVIQEIDDALGDRRWGATVVVKVLF